VSEQSGAAIGRQAGWNYAVFALSKSMTLIMTVVLARLLGPADFGLFALALLVMTMFDFIRDLGLAAALVQREEPWKVLAPTGLTLTWVFGLVIGGLAALFAPVASALLGEEQLTPMVRVLAVALVISSLSVLPMAALRRAMDYRGRLLPEVVGAVAKAAVAIGLAAGGFGVWSLVWAQIVSSVVTTAGYWITARTRTRFGFDRQLARGLVRFGIPVTAVAFLSFAVFNVPTASIGRLLGPVDLGYYTLAYRLPDLVVINLCAVVGDVLFSALSRLQNDRPALVARYLSTVRVLVSLTAPIGLGLAAVSVDVVALFYGADYAPAAPIAAALAVFTVLYSINFHAGDVYKSIGRPGLLTTLGVAKLVLLVPVIWWAAHQSALAVALAMIGIEAAFTVVRLTLVRRVLGVTIRKHVAILWGPLTAAGIAAAAAWGLTIVLPAWPAAVRLLIEVPVGAVVYLGALRLLAPSLVATIVGQVRGRAGKEGVS
jgi:PST family polysaccharide transporter